MAKGLNWTKASQKSTDVRREETSVAKDERLEKAQKRANVLRKKWEWTKKQVKKAKAKPPVKQIQKSLPALMENLGSNKTKQVEKEEYVAFVFVYFDTEGKPNRCRWSSKLKSDELGDLFCQVKIKANAFESTSERRSKAEEFYTYMSRIRDETGQVLEVHREIPEWVLSKEPKWHGDFPVELKVHLTRLGVKLLGRTNASTRYFDLIQDTLFEQVSGQ